MVLPQKWSFFFLLGLCMMRESADYTISELHKIAHHLGKLVVELDDTAKCYSQNTILHISFVM